MRGKTLTIGLLGFAAIFAVSLWYAQNYAFYDSFAVNEVQIAGRAYKVSAFRGIDASSSPLKLRACFRLEGEVEAPTAPAPEPLVAPGWFDCFDAETIAGALASGEARAYLAAEEEADGVDRILALYPDGRAYMWRQLNARFAK